MVETLCKQFKSVLQLLLCNRNAKSIKHNMKSCLISSRKQLGDGPTEVKFGTS